MGHSSRTRLSGSVLAHGERLTDLAAIFKTLSDPTRLRILAALFSGERCVSDLCERLGMSQPAVSHQLRVLRSARLCKPRRAGREVFYSIDDAHVMVLVEQGLNHAAHHRSGRRGR
jgi:ArsR family transcriptional regulator